VKVGGHPMESVSHGLWKEKWGGVPSFIKEHQHANHSPKNLLCMEDSKNPIASRWQRQSPLKTNFYLSDLQMKSCSTYLITASLCEGPFFYFYVESPPSIFMHRWYVTNISIIFYAPCLFYTNCYMFCLHFVTLLWFSWTNLLIVAKMHNVLVLHFDV
jgi:hypothetical protein